MRTRIRGIVALACLGGLVAAYPASAQQVEKKKLDEAIDGAMDAQRKLLAYTKMRQINEVAGPWGLRFAEVSDAIRAQVDIPADSGVVIVNVRPGSPAMKAGFRANDLLLSVDEEVIRNPAQLIEALARRGDKEAKAKIIRAGKEEEIILQMPAEDRARENNRRLFGDIPRSPFEAPASRGAAKIEYWIGVPVSPVDPTLRSHLASLPPDTGLIVNDVAPDSPAEKAGLKKNDILVTMDGKPLTSPKALVERVHASEGKPVPLEYLRGGKTNTVKITPEKHEALADRRMEFEGDHFIFRGPGQFFRIDPRGEFTPNIPFPRDGKPWQRVVPRDFEFRGRIDGAQPKDLDAAVQRLEDSVKESRIRGRVEGELTKEVDAAMKRMEAAIKELNAKVEEVRKTVEQLREAEGEDKPKDEE